MHMFVCIPIYLHLAGYAYIKKHNCFKTLVGGPTVYIWILADQEHFPSVSDGKESACSVGDLGSITGLGPWRRE